MVDRLGQVGLIPHPTSWVGKMIEKITLSNVHHTIICISDTEVLNVNPWYARIVPIEHSDWAEAIWSDFDLTEEQAQGCADWARARDGRPYNFIAIGFIALNRIFGVKYPKPILDWLSDDRSYECAQLADAALTLGAGIKVFDDGRPFGLVAPGDFEVLYKKYGWWPVDFEAAVKLPGIKKLARATRQGTEKL